MSNQPYTPTTDDLELFKKIAQLRYSNEQISPEERRRAFDHFEHMLNAIEAAAEQRGAVIAWREGYVQGVQDERHRELIKSEEEPRRANPYVYQLGAQGE